MADTLVDFYEFLGVGSTADLSAILAAIQSSRDRVRDEMKYPDRHIWASAMLTQLDRAAAAFATDDSRQRYDAALREQRAIASQHGDDEDDEDDDLLLIDPPYVFATGDTDLAYTVPALARKLDADPERGLKAIRDGSVQAMLRYVGYSRPNRKRFDALADAIDRLQRAIPIERNAQLLEQVIILCDASIEQPELLVNEDLASGTRCEIATLRARPDHDTTCTLALQHGGPRGYLFGMAWVEDTWGVIASPTAVSATVKGAKRQVVALDMGLGRLFQVNLKLPSAQLLKLSRPGRHDLHVAVLLQPGTEHERLVHIVAPVELVAIPGKAAFEPAQARTPMVFRGNRVTVHAALQNKGDLPLQAVFAQSSAPDTTASPRTLADTGQVDVEINTAAMPFGSRFERRVTYRASGDHPEATCEIVGEILPTAFQQLFRQRSVWKRVALAGGVGLSALFLGLLTLTLGFGILLWIVWVALIAGASAGAAWWIAPRVAGHMRASGVEVKYATVFPQRALLLTAGGVGAVVALLAMIPPFAVGTKLTLVMSLLLLIGAAWGFFLEAVSDKPLSAGTASAARASSNALVNRLRLALKRAPIPYDAGLYAQVVAAGLCLVVFLWLVISLLHAGLPA